MRRYRGRPDGPRTGVHPALPYPEPCHNPEPRTVVRYFEPASRTEGQSGDRALPPRPPAGPGRAGPHRPRPAARPPSTPPTPRRTPSPAAAAGAPRSPRARVPEALAGGPQGVLAPGRADPPDQPGQRRVDADRRRDHRDGRGHRRARHRALPVHRPPRHLGHRRLDADRLARRGPAGPRRTTRSPDASKTPFGATELGVKCLLVADEGVLWTLHRARPAGIIPADTTLKVSAADRARQPGRVRGVRETWAPTRSTCPANLTLDHLTEIRRVSAAPMDMYIEAPDDLGGYVRMYEVAELIRRGAPLYLKFGLSKAPAIYPVRAPSARRDPVNRPGTGAARQTRPGSARTARSWGRHGAARLPAAWRSASVRYALITFRTTRLHKSRRSRTQSHTPLLSVSLLIGATERALGAGTSPSRHQG
ncbi:hypothetical protein SALBM311S_10445 [Streptomyces alboniger]